MGSHVRVTCSAQYFFSWFTSLCYRRKVGSVAAGLATGGHLKVHKIEIFFGFDFEICIISLLVMSKY